MQGITGEEADRKSSKHVSADDLSDGSVSNKVLHNNNYEIITFLETKSSNIIDVFEG